MDSKQGVIFIARLASNVRKKLFSSGYFKKRSTKIFVWMHSGFYSFTAHMKLFFWCIYMKQLLSYIDTQRRRLYIYFSETKWARTECIITTAEEHFLFSPELFYFLFFMMEEEPNRVVEESSPNSMAGEADEEDRDPDSNSNQPLLKRHGTLSSNPLAMVGAKVAHIESLDYE